MKMLAASVNHRLLDSGRPTLGRHPPDDVERQLWMWLESGRSQVASKGTIDGGHYYYRARFYTPQLGRFVSWDPIGYDAGISLLEYVWDNPCNLTDPTGLQRIDAYLPWLIIPGWEIRDFAAMTKCNVETGEMEIIFGDHWSPLHPCVQTVVLAHEGVHAQQQSECCKRANEKYRRSTQGKSDLEKKRIADKIFWDNQLWVDENRDVFECPAHSLGYMLCEIGLMMPGIDPACCAALTEKRKTAALWAFFFCDRAAGKEVTPCPF